MRNRMSALHKRRLRWSIASTGAVLASLLVVAAPAAAQPPAHTAAVHGGSAAAGAHLTAAVTARPRQYTQAEIDLLNARGFDDDQVSLGRSGPVPRHRALGAAAASPADVHQATTSLPRDSTIASTSISGGASYASYVGEPSTDANGSNIFQTGNWYATRSTDIATNFFPSGGRPVGVVGRQPVHVDGGQQPRRGRRAFPVRHRNRRPGGGVQAPCGTDGHFRCCSS